MLLDVIVIDDCNGLLFVTPSEGENQRSDGEAFEMFSKKEIMMEIQLTVKSSFPFAFDFFHILHVCI